MNFELPGPLVDLAAGIRVTARENLAPRAIATAANPTFPRDAARLCAAHGWGGLAGRATVARSPSGILAAVVAVEAMARECPRSADALHQMNFGAALLLERHASSAEQRHRLSEIVAGHHLCSIAVTEEHAGAQAAALKSRALDEGDGVVLDGSKKFVSHSEDADAFVVYASFGPAVADIGALMIQRGNPDLHFGDPVRFMSGERWRPLVFHRALIRSSDIIFRSGGFTDKAGFFDLEKLGNAARALGLGWCAFDKAVGYVSERRQFGRPLCEFQGVQWKLAEARLQLEAAQLTLYRAAARADRQALRGDDASCAKTMCNRSAQAACDTAVQLMGGTGYSGDSLVEYCFRKSRGHLINGGAVELMLTRIAEGIFDRKFPQQIS